MNCLIIASGPSLTQEDVNTTRGYFDFTIVVNDNYKICPWADLLYACDNRWWKYHKGVPEFKGMKLSPFEGCAKGFSIGYVPATYSDFSVKFPIAFGRNSGYQALGLAAALGYKDIALLGFEFTATDKQHWFGDHPIQIKVASSYDLWIEDMNAAAPILKDNGIKVTNLSKNTAVKCFDIVSVEHYVQTS